MDIFTVKLRSLRNLLNVFLRELTKRSTDFCCQGSILAWSNMDLLYPPPLSTSPESFSQDFWGGGGRQTQLRSEGVQDCWCIFSKVNFPAACGYLCNLITDVIPLSFIFQKNPKGIRSGKRF